MPSSDLHKEAPLGEMHRAHNWEYASAAVREAAGGFEVLDLNKVALQTDDYTLWILTVTSPAAWRKLSSPLFDDRGAYDASTNLFPSTGGSGAAGAIKADDVWYVSDAGTLGATPVVARDALRALIDSPLQVAANWRIVGNNIDRIGEETVIRDSDNGIVGKTAGKINFLNIARTFKSFLQNFNTAARTYIFPDVNGSVMMIGTYPTIAAAITTDLGSVGSPALDITGDIAQITSFGTVAVGTTKYGRFTGNCEIVHHDTQMITPDKGNINTEPGDYYEAISLGSGNWEILQYRRRSGDIPPGTEIDFMGATVPDGYIRCDGANVLRLGKYARLFAAIQVLHGVGDGSTTFGLPDSRRRVAVGAGGAGTSELGNVVGDTSSEEAHIQTEAELRAHAHAVGHGGSQWVGQGFPSGLFAGGAIPTTNPWDTESIGSSDPMNIMQSSIVVTKCIKF